MASIIRIKRSGVLGNPAVLRAGELAYSSLTWSTTTTGGDKLYIGVGVEDVSTGNAATHVVIGGAYYTGLIDAGGTGGTLTTNAKSIPVLSATGTIDKWYVGNVYTTGNTITTTDTNGNLVLNANGTGKIKISNAWTLPSGAGTNNYLLTSDGNGGSSWAAPAASSFTLTANTGTDTFNTGETLTFTGTAPIVTAVSDNTITISATNASTTAKGVASFDSTNFTVSSGAVSIATGGVSNTNLANSSITINSTAVSLGGTITGLAVTSGKLSQFSTTTSSELAGVINDETGTGVLVFSNSPTLVTPNIGAATATSVTASTGNLTLNATSGTIDVSGKKITSVGTPQSDTDAATKGYVDGVAQGLHAHQPVQVATTAALAGTVSYDNGTSGVGATLTLSTALTTLDGYTLLNGDRILVKNQANQVHNGIYTWATGGTVLTRATDADTAAKLAGGDFVFVINGTQFGDCGFVQTEKVTSNFGTSSNIIFAQFSGAGAYTAGDGMTQSGTTFNVVGTADKITVSADAVTIASTYAGQSSIITLGNVTTGTWSADTIAQNKGGTGFTTYATGDLIYASAANTLSKLAAATDGQVLQLVSGAPAWGDIDGGTY